MNYTNTCDEGNMLCIFYKYSLDPCANSAVKVGKMYPYNLLDVAIRTSVV